MHAPMQMLWAGLPRAASSPTIRDDSFHHPGERARVNLGMRRWRSIRAIMESSGSSPTALFDRRAWRAHRNRAAAGAVNFLHDEIGERLLDRLDLINREFPDVLDLGARDGALASRLAQRPGTTRVVMAEPAPRFLAEAGGERVAADPELMPFRDASFDLVVSNLVLHWAGRSARRAGAIAPRAAAGRAVAGGDARRADAGRTAHGAVRGRAGRGRRGQPARVAIDRTRRRGGALTARRLCAAGRRQRDDHRRPIPMRWR